MTMLAAALLAFPATAPAPDAVRLVRSFEEGAVVAVSIDQTSSTEVASESYCPIVDGERQEEEAWSSEDPGGSSEFELTVQFEDTYGGVDEDGRVRGLVRRFEEIAGGGVDVVPTDDGDEMREEALLTSPLEGRAVRFTWDEEDGEYAQAFLEEAEDKSMDALLLGDQKIDAFGDWFLPPAEENDVEVDDRWDLGLDRWNDFLTMGGEFWIDVEDAEPLDEQAAADIRDFEEQLLTNGEGAIQCHLDEIEREGEVRVAVIRFEGDLATHAEQDFTDEYDGTRSEVTVKVEHDMKIEGTCRWNIGAGRALGIETRITMTTTTTEHSVIDDDSSGDVQTYGSELITVEDTVTEVSVGFERAGG